MEDNNKKKGKNSVIDASVILSFAVAIFAIFSLVMADISLSQKSHVSYAAPTSELPSSFTFNKGDYVIATNGDQTTSFEVPMYMADNDADNPVFCVEHTATVQDNESYSSGDAITDYGLLYLLNNSYANGVSVTGATGNDAKYIEAWVTQSAIWMYLYEKSGGAQTPTTSKNYLTAAEVNGIKNAYKLNKRHGSDDPVLVYEGANLYTYVSRLVSEALTVSDVVKLSVTKQNDEISASEDKKFYFSSLITVTGDPSSSLKSYTVSLDGIDGAKAVKEDGSELEAVVTTPTAFMVRIPADKITEGIQKVTVSVNGTFETLEGKYYTAATTDLQKVVSVKAGQTIKSAGTEVEFYGAPDTGMSTAQTIYFIGLIVLLCGVGIVYANAKPVQVKQ